MTAGQAPQDYSSRYILGFAFLLSLMIHLFFFTTFPLRFIASDPTLSPSREKVIRVRRIPEKQGQIVDMQDNKNITKDTVETDFLSDKNRKVEKQTRSLNITRQESQSETPTQTMVEGEKKSKYKLDLSEKALQKITEKTGRPLISSTMSSNYLPEITIGSETLLNTKEFAFHTFYIRMKREIEGCWHPDSVLNQNQAIHGTFVTTITVTLDDQGYLLQAYIIKPSGIPMLDQEAVQSINKASPFPNPPKELLTEDKKIRVNWSFIFDRTSLM